MITARINSKTGTIEYRRIIPKDGETRIHCKEMKGSPRLALHYGGSGTFSVTWPNLPSAKNLTRTYKFHRFYHLNNGGTWEIMILPTYAIVLPTRYDSTINRRKLYHGSRGLRIVSFPENQGPYFWIRHLPNGNAGMFNVDGCPMPSTNSVTGYICLGDNTNVQTLNNDETLIAYMTNLPNMDIGIMGFLHLHHNHKPFDFPIDFRAHTNSVLPHDIRQIIQSNRNCIS